jgi:hypothetical protein
MALRENPKFRRFCDAYTDAFFKQVRQNVACSTLHAAEQRCARWLLMCDDQVGDDRTRTEQPCCEVGGAADGGRRHGF